MIPRCPACQALLAPALLHCASCAAPLFDFEVIARARDRARRLVSVLRDSPFVRSAGLLSYTLRSRTPGFLENDDHPLTRALLESMRETTLDAGALGVEQLLPYVEKNWIAPKHPVLARAHRAVRERHGSQLRALATGPSSQSM